MKTLNLLCKLLFSIYLLLLTNLTYAVTPTTLSLSDGVGYYNMALDNNDNLYIAFPKSGLSTQGGVPSVEYMKHDTSTLSNLVDKVSIEELRHQDNSFYVGIDVQVAINPVTQQPVVVFQDPSINNALVIFSRTILHDNVGEWNVITPYYINSGNKPVKLQDNISRFSIAFDKAGKLLIAYREIGRYQPLSVINVDLQQKTWEYVGNPHIANDTTSDTRIYLKVTTDNKIYVAYEDKNQAPQVAKYEGQNNIWQQLSLATNIWYHEYNFTPSSIGFALSKNDPLLLFSVTDTFLHVSKYDDSAQAWNKYGWNNQNNDILMPQSLGGYAPVIATNPQSTKTVVAFTNNNHIYVSDIGFVLHPDNLPPFVTDIQTATAGMPISMVVTGNNKVYITAGAFDTSDKSSSSLYIMNP